MVQKLHTYLCAVLFGFESQPHYTQYCQTGVLQVGCDMTKCANCWVDAKPVVPSACIIWWTLNIPQCLLWKVGDLSPASWTNYISCPNRLQSNGRPGQPVLERLMKRNFPLGWPQKNVGLIVAIKAVVPAVLERWIFWLNIPAERWNDRCMMLHSD